MSDNRLPTEVELVYEVMPCNSMRTSQEPPARPHSCGYFRKWGTYHSFDYRDDGVPETGSILQEAVYAGRAPLTPEILSGCRKAPIMSVGINPNLPGWWRSRHQSLNPLFDSYKQFAHYFRYRAVSKLEMSRDDYRDYGGSRDDRPLVRNDEGEVEHSRFELSVPLDDNGDATIVPQLQPQTMYRAYEALLHALGERMGWPTDRLSVGEDLSYGNMVACPSAKWTTRRDERNPLLPPMTRRERTGIVTECFHSRKYFLRQLFQSLPPVLLIFSNSTARAFIGEMQGRFIQGNPQPGDTIDELMGRNVRLLYGTPGGRELSARVIFAPHITGNPASYGPARELIVDQLEQEARAGNIAFNHETGHLERPAGACVFCPMLDIGACGYDAELEPISDAPSLHADSPGDQLLAEKRTQYAMIDAEPSAPSDVEEIWDLTDETDDDDFENAEEDDDGSASEPPSSSPAKD